MDSSWLDHTGSVLFFQAVVYPKILVYDKRYFKLLSNPCNDGNALFTAVPLKSFSDKNVEAILLIGLKAYSYLFSCSRNAQTAFFTETQIENINIINIEI